MRHKGFTFVEIVIVLVILAVLAAVLFRLLMPGNLPAYRSSCASNEKQIGLGLNQYQQDYDQRLPPPSNSSVPGTGNWVEMAYPYVKSSQLFRCPYELSRSNAKEPSIVTSYFINRNLAAAEITPKIPAARIILLGEGEAATGDYACPTFTACVGFNEAGPVGPVPEEARKRHQDGANYVFLDGHVKWLKPVKVEDRPGKNVQASFKLQ